MSRETTRIPGSRLQRAHGRMNGADAVLRMLEAEGVELVFGLPGGAALPLYDALARGSSVRHVLARHEQGAGHMAEGYARASGAVGVAFATSGPGATNLVTPIADAWMDSTPLVCITGQVRSTLIGTDAFQECAITAVVAPIVKHSWLVGSADEIPPVLRAALHVAHSGRSGPVVVDIPRDVQEAELEFAYPEEIDLERLLDGRPARGTAKALPWPIPVEPDRRSIEAAASLVRTSRRPVLYVGGGAVNANASSEVVRLAHAGRIPVVATLMGKGAFPETHRLFVGWPGMHGPKWSNLALNHADLIIAVGARFDDRVTGRLDAFAPEAAVVHLDADPYELGKLRHADVGLVAPLRRSLDALAHRVEAARADGWRPMTGGWLRQIARWREQYPLHFPRSTTSLKPQRLLAALRRLTSDRDDVIWTTGVGQHQMWAMQHLLCERPRTFITSGGLGTMGYGLPAAIGAKAARPDATVVCIDGDGCFQMTCQELATAVEENLPIVVIIVNNGYLGMVHQWQDLFYEERASHVELTGPVPDYARLAEAYGAHSLTVRSEHELEPVLRQALALETTVVVDAHVDQHEQCYPMIMPGQAAVDAVPWPLGSDPDTW